MELLTLSATINTFLVIASPKHKSVSTVPFVEIGLPSMVVRLICEAGILTGKLRAFTYSAEIKLTAAPVSR